MSSAVNGHAKIADGQLLQIANSRGMTEMGFQEHKEDDGFLCVGLEGVRADLACTAKVVAPIVEMTAKGGIGVDREIRRFICTAQFCHAATGPELTDRFFPNP